MEPAKAGFHRIVADILRGAPAEDAAGIAWTLVCGKAVSARTQVMEFRDGVLRVRVPDETWRSNLSGFEQRYIELLTPLLSKSVEKIEFIAPRK